MLVRRALLLRCPCCGERAIFTSWFRMCDSCHRCGLVFQRGERGYWLGAWFVNLMLAETLFCAWLAGVLWWTWPAPDWALAQWSATALMLTCPFALFPWSRTLYLAFDLHVRPPDEADFSAPVEPARRPRPRARGA
ncbi:MAG: DUF983 domain-containing protein [Gemmatimonadales bacterium]|nr:DUF983 domain-containing protein [Gemmatimonadales bacterium]